MYRAETILQDTSRRRSDAVGGERRHDDEVKICARNPGIGKRHLCCTLCERRDRLIIRCDAALMNPCALNNPRIIGLHHLFKVKVCQHLLREIIPRPDDARADLMHSNAPPSREPRVSDRAPFR